MELMGIADEGAVTIDGQIEVTNKLGWKWIEARAVQVAVSYTHLTLPTNREV